MTIIGSSVLQRDPGATVVVAPYGPRGPIIAGTSVTPVFIEDGPVTFEMSEYGLGFSPGIRVRATATEGVNQWIEGVVTAYDGIELDVMVDLHSGSDTYYSWQITVAGEPGIPGPQGPKGDTGDVPEAPENHIKYARLDGQWANISVDFAAKAPIDAPLFTGDARAVTPPTADNSVSIATTAYVKANVAGVTAGFQPIDADLTSIAGATAIGALGLHYRKTSGAWVSLTMGSGITLDTTSNTLNVTAGGGNVSNSGTPTNLDVAQWASTNTIKGVPLATWRLNSQFFGTTSFRTETTAASGLDITPSAGAVLYAGAGTDPDVGIRFSSKGNGDVTMYNANFARVCARFLSAPSADTFPQFVANVNYCGLESNPSTKPIVFGSVAKLKGVTDGSNAAAGEVGEYKVATAVGIPLGPESVSSLTSITLTPGDWDVGGSTYISGPASHFCYLSIGPQLNALNSVAGQLVNGYAGGYGDYWGVIGSNRWSVTSNTVLRLTVSCSSGATANDSKIWARRVR